LEIQEKETVASQSSNPGGDRKIWDLIWKAKVPPATSPQLHCIFGTHSSCYNDEEHLLTSKKLS
jgi:hypothetical protein